MTAKSHFHLKRLRVLKSGMPAYDQTFHLGLNIIRGENGSGKSTIADFIFYILGGEFENWKTIAGTCDEVQAEVGTKQGTLTMRREIGKSQTPISVYFGAMRDAEQHALDGWERYAIRRTEARDSFSQIIFRSSGIPEAQSQGASNITMHQVLRLLYSDQRTPSALLFKYEPFDTREIREAVGDLICGMSAYELYEIELRLRAADKEFDEKNRRFSALLSALPRDEAISSTEHIEGRMRELEREHSRLNAEIDAVDDVVAPTDVASFARARASAGEDLRKLRSQLADNEQRSHIVGLELSDLRRFVDYLEDLASKVERAEGAAEIVGNIEFTHCPACLKQLTKDHGATHCVVCGEETDPEEQRSRYLQIKIDLSHQIRESRQLVDEKERAEVQLARETRRLKRAHQEKLSEYVVRFEHSSSPRDSFVAERHRRLGALDRERGELEGLRERVAEIEALSSSKAELQAKIERLRDRLRTLEAASSQRRTQALTRVSEAARSILRRDLDRQEEFKAAGSVSINFGDNSVLVDGELNFAESSNVIVKNAAIFSLFLAACQDERFYHPRFLLLDNIEDKGMEQDRSHNFQALIAEKLKTAHAPHQVIFTTSMPNPTLEIEDYVVGPRYTHERRTLNIRGSKLAPSALD